MLDESKDKPQYASAVTRRTFLGTTGLIVGAAVVASASPAGSTPTFDDHPLAPQRSEGYVLRINGQDHEIVHGDRSTVLDALREQVGLTGTKKGCDHGQCGACTVHLDGQRVLSCLLLAVAVQGRDLRTIEGITGDDGGLHPMQQAFIDHDAFQCGYCTPGQIMSAISCVKEGHADSPVAIQEFMSGNLCRCAAYPNIVAAIGQGRQRMGP